MPVIIKPISTATSVATGGKVAPVEQILQPGTIVDAQVLAARANLVKIAISGMLLEVMSEVQLQPGTALKLQVSQTADSLRLAVVDQQLPNQATRVSTGAGGQGPTTSTASSGASAQSQTATTTRVVAPPLQPDQITVRAVSAEPTLAMQAAAVSQAVRAAAPLQASLSPLFANLPVIVASPIVPQDVKATAAQLLAARPALTENLDSNDVRNAFKASGVLLEATMAKGVPAGPSAGLPDLKAALTVFRQLVANWSASEGKPAQPGPLLQQGGVTQALQAASSPAAGSGEAANAPLAVPAVSTKPGDMPVRVPVVPNMQPTAADATEPLAILRALREQAGTTTATPNGQTLADGEGPAVKLAPFAAPPTSALQASPRSAAEPAPPFRGSAPSVQPIAAPSIEPDMPAPQLAAQLLDQADGALARQTLLQVASLPERFDTGSISQPQQRWAFEIPFATPQGTAVTQFEIAEDDSNGMAETGAPKRVWRARFTLDIETTGPVHALVSLVGDRTTVRMWAERPDTATQLRDNAQALDSALRLADLQPGDIVVQAGAPPQTKPARAGHFLDRAT